MKKKKLPRQSGCGQIRLDIEGAAYIQEWLMRQSFTASSLFDIDGIAGAGIHRFDLQTDPRPDRSL